MNQASIKGNHNDINLGCNDKTKSQDDLKHNHGGLMIEMTTEVQTIKQEDTDSDENNIKNICLSEVENGGEKDFIKVKGNKYLSPGQKNACVIRKKRVKIETVSYDNKSSELHKLNQPLNTQNLERHISHDDKTSPTSIKSEKLSSSLTIELINSNGTLKPVKKSNPRGRPKGVKRRPKYVIEKEKAEKAAQREAKKEARKAKQEARASKVTNRDQVKTECDICKKVFSNAWNLTVHTRGVHNQIKKHMCSFCGKTFAHRSDQKRHEDLLHLKVSKYKCPEEDCDKIFASNTHMADHHNAIHLGLRPFVCQYCGKAYGFRGRCYEHVKTEHEGAKPRVRSKQKHKNKAKNKTVQSLI